MHRSPSSIERIKLIGTFLSSLAVALISLGVFAPLVYHATSVEIVPSEKRVLIYGVVGICVIGAAALHSAGQAVLGFLEDAKIAETTNERE